MMWEDTAHSWEVVAQAVDPHDPGAVLGEVSGLDLSGCKVTEGYYTDTRVSADVRTVGEDGWPDLSRIRLTLRVPEWGWSRDLITGFVTGIKPSERQGTRLTSYELDSTLWALSVDLLDHRVVVGSQGSVVTAAGSLLDSCGFAHDLSGAQDRLVQSAVVWEPGNDPLGVLFDLCGSDSRLDVDGRGVVTMRRYVAPSMRTPQYDLDPTSPRTLVLSDPIEGEPGDLDVPGKVVAVASVGDGEAVAGSAWVAPEARSSWERRGYRLSESVRWQGEGTPTSAQLSLQAANALAAAQGATRRWTLSVGYMDARAGDVARLRLRDGWHRVLVQTVETDLSDRTQALTLKEV